MSYQKQECKKNQPTLTNTNWYKLYAKCKSLNASEKVKTGMIWGCQWDITMNWLISSGAKTSDEVNKNSSSWGNYSNSTGNAAAKVTENGTETNKYGTKQNTGYSEYWKANNIYDLAGNCWEWTQEAYETYHRAVRGGYYDNDSPAFCRNYIYVPGFDYSSFFRYSSYFNNKVTLNSRV